MDSILSFLRQWPATCDHYGWADLILLNGQFLHGQHVRHTYGTDTVSFEEPLDENLVIHQLNEASVGSMLTRVYSGMNTNSNDMMAYKTVNGWVYLETFVPIAMPDLKIVDEV